MFTGLIETTGTITAVTGSSTSIELTVQPQRLPFETTIGASVAIDGACLTVVKQTDKGALVFTAVKETLQRTTLSTPQRGCKVNMERALRINGRLDGHMVLGHVDGVGVIESDRKEGIALLRTVKVPGQLSRFLAEKGSVSIDGISLTIAHTNDNLITISLIPHTLKETTMIEKKQGEPVNIECDVLARYICHMVSAEKKSPNVPPSTNNSLLKQMERYGF